MKQSFQIRGMYCPNCEKRITTALQKMEGVKAVRVSYASGRAEIESKKALDPEMLLAIRTAGGEIRTAFNTCQSCYTSGHGYYVADGTELICQNCGFRFTAEQVGLEGRGGCNPWPIPASERTETENSILISYNVLADAKEIFSNWSK